MRGRMGAHKVHATHDSRALTESARAASPGSLTYWEREVDPEGVLSDAERVRRAEHARKSYMVGLAYKSARARKKGGDG